MGILEDKYRRDLGLRGLRPNTIDIYTRCCRSNPVRKRPSGP